MLSQNHSLKPFNTLGLEINADVILPVTTGEELRKARAYSRLASKPFLLLGGGSNVLFLNDFNGVVALNQIKGISVSEHDDYYDLHVGAGENWHNLVRYCLQQNIAGLENLALIPGVAGSAPIQNIGAYGLEFKDVCHYVDVISLTSDEQIRLTSQECQFGYRDSIFKHQYREDYAIIAVGLRLSKQWQPRLTYGELTRLDAGQVTPTEVFDAVCRMRSSKLPDPAIQGNVGSFFKNPLVTAGLSRKLLADYPSLPHYPQPDGKVKLAAGWLIDQCGLKGYQMGGAAVHRLQALVLINNDHALPQDIVKLAKYVRQTVGDKFNVWLEPEVRFIDSQGECDAVGAIS
ncbi:MULTISPECIES: UDP-N-acetylmuramate dehydrogenase [Tatumella]|uniref:UDP-N-acetylenolpyruvoylglucosamine reductase n=1 Tax=Tatumella punctata TaxID=399969 RepID=A0ABW1VU67_9GAMM|nr:MULTISPECIES: UDP-N-acetylmuramate dehydrogenase [unclassified Tatumella]MBS0857668.1 UDP-N-acetylmuramate dehydrogenase [Tatumella sp. JGM16]MBS0878967.1 UDP-N-acetylmuramate dehydrogenase [Tatumella sp. JGM82]MBS0892405.1 UDP-N-acetylmuramate dehydrogenase [Tatumella sp. JGM94]MBS0895592.1 UDP-N-acetylmuramate dehydrogenase [Tatumella sp. JGM130]MBS0903494.1 UDP-N-acetylmuramate dehydrogenase [Tatumella sp. JGM100]